MQYLTSMKSLLFDWLWSDHVATMDTIAGKVTNIG